MTKEEKREYDKRYYQANREKKKEYYLDNKEKKKEYDKQWRLDNPKRYAYLVQKSHAKQRGIGWEITYEEWVGWWGEDFSRRGRGKNDLCMARIGDTGPYKLGNIKKLTNRENVQERNK